MRSGGATQAAERTLCGRGCCCRGKAEGEAERGEVAYREGRSPYSESMCEESGFISRPPWYPFLWAWLHETQGKEEGASSRKETTYRPATQRRVYRPNRGPGTPPQPGAARARGAGASVAASVSGSGWGGASSTLRPLRPAHHIASSFRSDRIYSGLSRKREGRYHFKYTCPAATARRFDPHLRHGGCPVARRAVA